MATLTGKTASGNPISLDICVACTAALPMALGWKINDAQELGAEDPVLEGLRAVLCTECKIALEATLLLSQV